MKVVKDYTDFEKSGGGRFQMYTISLTTTFDNKENADMVAKMLEDIKIQLENILDGKTNTINLKYNRK